MNALSLVAFVDKQLDHMHYLAPLRSSTSPTHSSSHLQMQTRGFQTHHLAWCADNFEHAWADCKGGDKSQQRKRRMVSLTTAVTLVAAPTVHCLQYRRQIEHF